MFIFFVNTSAKVILSKCIFIWTLFQYAGVETKVLLQNALGIGRAGKECGYG